MRIYIKVVARLDTTRPLAWLETKARVAVRNAFQACYQQVLDDPAIAIVDWSYKWKAASLGGNLVELYPKLIAELDTTYTQAEIKAMLDAAIPDMKQAIRDALVDAKTAVLSWHVHYSAGSVDEVEA